MKRCVIVFILMILITPVSISADGPQVKITEVYYHEEPGSEYVVLENWGDDVNLKGWTLSDGEGEVKLPDVVLGEGERLVISEDDEYEDVWREEPDFTWKDDLVVKGTFELASKGDGLLLMDGTDVIDAFYYGSTDVGSGWVGEPYTKAGYGVFAKRKKRDSNCKEDWNWTRDWKVGASNFSTQTFSFKGNSTLFSSPDSSLNSLENYLDDVKNNLAISVYQLDSPRIARKIANLSEEGVTVKLMVESSPVGGLTAIENYCLSLLEERGVDVSLHGKEYSPYPYLHCKYMVADNRSVLITSENLGETGFPSDSNYGNRGWGAVLRNKELASYFLSVFKEDRYFSSDYHPVHISNVTKEEEFGGYRPKYEEKSFSGTFDVTPILSPDTSMSRRTLLGMIDSAQRSIYVQQFYAYNWSSGENPYLQHLVQAADRGVDVKIILDSTWYNVQENVSDNDDMIERLNRLAEEKDIPLEARLIADEHGFSKVHNKGMVVDEEKVLISSINWNSNSVLQNRETGLIIKNGKVGSYFSTIFKNDWRSDILAPIADAGRNMTVDVGEIVSFTGEYSWDDEGISEYRWDLDGDGKFEEKGKNVSTVYRKTGVYKVKLKVVDMEGNVDTDVTYVKVKRSDDGRFFKGEENGPPYLLALLLCMMVSVPAVIFYVKD